MPDFARNDEVGAGDFRMAFDFAGKRMGLGKIEPDAISAISHRREN